MVARSSMKPRQKKHKDNYTRPESQAAKKTSEKEKLKNGWGSRWEDTKKKMI